MSQAEHGQPQEGDGPDLPASSPEALDAFGFVSQGDADAMEGSTAYGQPAAEETWVGFDAHGELAAQEMPDASPDSVMPVAGELPLASQVPDESLVPSNPAAMDWRLASPASYEPDNADSANEQVADAVRLDEDESSEDVAAGTEADTADGMPALDVDAARTSASGDAEGSTAGGVVVVPDQAPVADATVRGTILQRPAMPPAPTGAITENKPAGDHATIDEEVVPAAHRAMRLNRRLQGVVPLAVSMLLHAGLLTIGLALVEGAIRPPRTMQEQIIIPEIKLSDTGLTGAIPTPGLEQADPGLAARSMEMSMPDMRLDSGGKGFSGRQPGQDESGTGTIIGLGPGMASGSVGDQGQTHRGNGPGSMGAAFGVPGGSDIGSGLHVKFMGMGGNAKRIVLMCDASGSMVGGPWERVRQEMKTTIGQLKPVQAFNIILFNGDTVKAFRNDLVMATVDNLQAAGTFLDEVQPRSCSDPSESIKAAFRQNPELLFVLCDGFDDYVRGDPGKIGVLFDSSNPGRKVKVNIVLVRNNPESQIRSMMKAIAESTGGAFKQLSSDMR